MYKFRRPEHDRSSILSPSKTNRTNLSRFSTLSKPTEVVTKHQTYFNKNNMLVEMQDQLR